MLPGLLAIFSVLFIVERGKESAAEHLVDVESLLCVSLQAHLDEVFEVGRPLVVVLDLWHIHVDNRPEQFTLVSNSGEWWVTSGQLIRKAAIRPDIDRLGILNAFADLGCEPVCRTLPRLTNLSVLVKSTSEA